MKLCSRACACMCMRTLVLIFSPTCFCESCFMTSLVCNNCQIVEQGGDQHPEGVNLGEHSSADMGTADGTVGR